MCASPLEDLLRFMVFDSLMVFFVAVNEERQKGLFVLYFQETGVAVMFRDIALVSHDVATGTRASRLLCRQQQLEDGSRFTRRVSCNDKSTEYTCQIGPATTIELQRSNLHSRQ